MTAFDFGVHSAHFYNLLAVTEGSMWHSLADILILLAAAIVLGTLAEQLRQSAILGYIAAGTLVGPNLLGWVSDRQSIFDLAELGVALLLFAIGLEFSLPRLRRLGRIPLLAGILQIILTLLGGLVVSLLLGFSVSESLAIGAMIALSSTACVVRMLNDRAELDAPHGRTALGILLVQDMAVIPLMLIITALVGKGSAGEIAIQLSVSLLLAIVFVAVFYGLFNFVLPRLLELSSLRRNRDFPILLAMVMAAGSAWAAHRLGLSPALGAFVAGVLLAISPFATQIRADVQPLKTVLVTLFFAAVGMFGDLNWVIGHLGIVLAVVAAIVAGKLLITFGATWFCGQPWQFALGTGLCLSQVGEFSFVLATVARGTAGAPGILSESTFRLIISSTIATLLLTPYLIQLAPIAANLLRRLGGKRPAENEPLTTDAPAADLNSRRETDDDLILILGFGPAGQRVAGELLQVGLKKIVVIDLNHENLQMAEQYGLRSQLGDATQIEVLEHAGLYRSRLVITTLPSPTVCRQIIFLVRQLAPSTALYVRCRYHLHHWQLLAAGADVVVDEEEHVGECLAKHILESPLLQQLRASQKSKPDTSAEHE
ncbi:Inner membrane protein YbaL [Gimesia panareensis]|uniref:Inner membrane protein YbaL n=1 Tax=Gimesia panareensis TaxID=2527978 RepID=A0A517Q9L3_9PLAN|nr:cation:proton antiporter [Gimesia panareensis]QDT28322.1 Inner membrane protein YbaL [Gimesia panareensis]